MISPRTGRRTRAHRSARVAVVFALAFGLIAAPHLTAQTAAVADTEAAAEEGSIELSLTAGSYDQLRGAADLAVVLNDAAALRLNAMYEDTDSYRNYVNIERWGVNPTAAFRLGENTELRVGYEHFVDDRKFTAFIHLKAHFRRIDHFWHR